MAEWNKAYMAAALETDWTMLPDRIQAAEHEIHEKQRVLLQDHGGTPEERQALVNALAGLRILVREQALWQYRRSSARPARRAA
jgi:hypothetical protein